MIKPGEAWKAAQEKLAQEKEQWTPSAPAAATGGQGAFSKLDEASKEISKPITAAKLRLGELAKEMTKSNLAGDHQAAQENRSQSMRRSSRSWPGSRAARFSADQGCDLRQGACFQSGAGAAVARSAGPLGAVISGVTAAASDYAAVKSGKLKKEDAARRHHREDRHRRALPRWRAPRRAPRPGRRWECGSAGSARSPARLSGAGVGIAAAAFVPRRRWTKPS